MRLSDYSIPLFSSKKRDAGELSVKRVVRRNAFGRVAPDNARGSEWAIISFAAFSFLGTILLSYYCLSGLDHTAPAPAADPTPVYDARAVPADSADALQNAATSRRIRSEHTGTRPWSRRHHDEPTEDSNNVGPNSSEAHSGAPLTYSLPSRRDQSALAANFTTALAAGGNAFASQQNASGYAAPDALVETVAPVPEPAAWSWIGLGGGLLIVARHAGRRRVARVESR